MELKDTVDLMLSGNYMDRFLAEYHQLNNKGYKEGTLEFTPNCPYRILYEQLMYMKAYRDVLEARAEIENIDLSVDAVF